MQVFLDTAEILNSDVVKINVEKGFEVLRNRQTGSKIYVLHVPGDELQGPNIKMVKACLVL